MPKARLRPTSRLLCGLEHLERRDLMAADMVLAWNDITLSAIRASNTPPPIASRAMAIVHTAIYDAVNAIDRTHEVYAVKLLASPLTSREAAVAAAAHAALSSLFPAQKATILDPALANALASIPNGTSEDLGIDLGLDVAARLLALRASDGATDSSSYAPGNSPGQWRPTPLANAQALLPQWGDVAPFGIDNVDAFAIDAIPALTSSEYSAALNEVKSLGSATSSTRTADQTQIALFWANGAGTATPPGHWNELAQVVAQQAGNTLSENARLFAALNVALADAAIVCWDIKFETDFWRPITAIRLADADGNDATAADPAWTPLIATPPFPTYTSGHSTFSGAAAAVLQDFFGRDDIAFTLASEHPDPTVLDRSFSSFSQAALESADSRLYGGIHFRFDNEDGLENGTAIGNFIANNLFQPADHGLDAGIVDGTLIVHGSSGPDNLRLDKLGNQIVVLSDGRRLASIAASDITSIAIDVHAGHDLVMLSHNIRVAATILGGQGNDMLHGGSRADRIEGNDGNDVLFGHGGDDHLLGGEGNDILFGLLGNDILEGGDGDDLLFGGPGLDTLLGGRGRNRLIQ